MPLTPDEQAALGALTETRTIHTVIDGFETDPATGAIYLMFPVPRGPRYQIGSRVTITFEDPR